VAVSDPVPDTRRHRDGGWIRRGGRPDRARAPPGNQPPLEPATSDGRRGLVRPAPPGPILGGMTIDLRSDTVTRPTPTMREAMARAEVGDDVYGEDPTVNRLEAMAAERLGMDAAVFVASGTMGNLSSLLAHCQRGEEAIVGDESHVFHYEAGGASALGGVVLHTVRTESDGTLPLDALEAAIRPRDVHFAPAGVICLENTHNRAGGAVVPPAYVREVARLARRHGLPVHLDGSRLFNASIAAGLPPTAWTEHVTSVQISLSKGLAAPVGSIVAGPSPFAARVRRVRKMLGGGMRQAGILAAAGIVALTEMVDRLAEDHANARELAGALAGVPGVRLDPASVRTNIVVFTLEAGFDVPTFLGRCRERGVLLTNFGAGRVRAVTHHDVSAADCRAAVDVVRDVLAHMSGSEPRRAREAERFRR
jgi:threonine aldolase